MDENRQDGKSFELIPSEIARTLEAVTRFRHTIGQNPKIYM